MKRSERNQTPKNQSPARGRHEAFEVRPDPAAFEPEEPPIERRTPRRRAKDAAKLETKDGAKTETKGKSKTLTAVLLLLVIVFGVVFGYSAYQLYSMASEYYESRQRYNAVADLAMSTTEPAATTAPFAVPGSEETEVAAIETSPIQVDFDALLAQCSDIVGWIYCEDTVINYPIVRGNDNDYYLHHFIDGSYNGGGTLFMDYKNNKSFSDPNSVIYGHRMNDGSMFASLKKYNTDPEYYSKHPTLYVNTPTQNYRMDIFAAFVCDADSDTYTFGFPDDAAFQRWLSRMVSQSDFKTDVEVGPQDHVLTLSTCTYEWYDARYVVMGKLVPIA